MSHQVGLSCFSHGTVSAYWLESAHGASQLQVEHEHSVCQCMCATGKRADVPEVTPTETVKGGPGLQREGDVTQAVHHGHLDPVARSRDALNKLLGRHERSNATPAAAVQPKPARSSKVPPAFEAPLSVPVFSRRREVGVVAEHCHFAVKS